MPSATPSAPVDWAANEAEIAASGRNALAVRAIQVETSSICNFRCASCALSLVDYDRPEKHMSAADFARVLARFPDLEKLELQGVGEVFLNPEVLEIIRAATSRGVAVHTFSNASVVTRELAAGIVAAGLAAVNFSLDGADEPTFRRLRKGGTLARYKRSFENLRQARAIAGAATPRIGVMTVVSKANLEQVPWMIALAESLGAESIVLTKLNVGPKPDQEPLLLDEADRARLDALPARAGGPGRLEVVRAWTPWTKQERMACYWPRHMAYVTVEGDVTPCCNYFDSREQKLGNVFDQDLDAIWNGEAYRAFRRQLASGELPARCRIC
jgi:pyrroloquinoline quinone biosynthesis protein E